MKLEDAFGGALNDPKKGLFLLLSQMRKHADAIQTAAEDGDLAGLKDKLAVGHEAVRKLDTFFTNVEGKAANLTANESGGVMDLSIPPERRT